MAKIAGTFANGGVHPQSGDRIFSAKNVKHVLSMMQSCGMCDTSGLWSFKVGIPAISGFGGHVYAVVPGVLGICVTSPMMNKYGNSGRATHFLEEFEKKYTIHQFDCLPGLQRHQKGFKVDGKNSKPKIGDIIEAAQVGDLTELTRYVALGADPFEGDYDSRRRVAQTIRRLYDFC
jgi:glutaminase